MAAALTTGHQEKGSYFRVEPEVSQQVSEGTCQQGGLAIPVTPRAPAGAERVCAGMGPVDRFQVQELETRKVGYFALMKVAGSLYVLRAG